MNQYSWEQIIIKIRKDPAYKDLVELAYFEEELPLNVERFSRSDEFQETVKLIQQLSRKKESHTLLDIGAGNGVASLSFALAGYKVTAVEPDPSETIGNGAIERLKTHYDLPGLEVISSYGEKLPFENGSFDIVYIRQAMHHANDLQQFIRESSRVLKKGGLLVTVRDHVILNKKDKEWFLKAHPLHQFYGGENAFTFEEYSSAIEDAGLRVKKILRHYDSVINYFPEPKEKVEETRKQRKAMITENLNRKLPAFIANKKWAVRMYEKRLDKKLGRVPDENKIPGRMISFFAVKP